MPRVSQPDFDAWLRTARSGDVPTLGQLLESYRSYLALLVRMQVGRRLQGKMDVDDLVQETFLTAADRFDQFRGTTEGEWTGWLRQVLASRLADQVRRHCVTQARDVRLERELVCDLDASSEALDRGLIAPGSSPSHQAARREQAVVLANAMDRLPEDYREVIILHNLQDLNFPEVARRMGRSIDSVKNLWLRALRRLRDSLGGRP